MSQLHSKRFPGESDEYRKAREELLHEEIALRRQQEKTAALRRSLPQGGKLKEDYVFEETSGKETKLSELFSPGKNTLVIYSFMYAADWEKPCRACNSVIDGLNGSGPHIRDRVNFVVVAKAPIQKFQDWGEGRGWSNLHLLSSEKNTYNADYFGENEEESQIPALNVFTKTEQGIFHFYNTELLYTPSDEGQHARHVDHLWPIWNMLDLTPEGRGTDWFPDFSYQ